MENRFVASEQNTSKKLHTLREKNANRNTHQKVKMLELGEARTGEKKQQKCQNKNA